MIYISELLSPEDLKPLLNQIDAGLESIEFSISDNLDNIDTQIPEYQEKLNRLNLTELAFHGPFLDLNPDSCDSLIREATLGRFSQCYDAALRLGAKKIVFHTGFIPSVHFPYEWPERMAEFWNRFLEDKKEIQILMENLYDPDPEQLRKVAELVESPTFLLCLDIGHANCYSNVPVTEWIDCLGASIGHVHLHDNDGSRDTHLALGEGNIPVDAVLTKLKKVAPTATYTIECATPESVLTSYKIFQRYFMTVPIPSTTRTTCSE